MPNDRGRVRGAVPGAALLALLALGAAAAPAQEEGDRVQVTLTSGKRYSGTLVSRSEREVVLRIGTSDISLPAAMVRGVEKVAEEAPAAPAPRAPEAPAPAAAGSGEKAAAGGPPRPATLLLRDGTVVEGYVIAKDDAGYWVVPGTARNVAREAVDEVYGDTEGLGGGGLSITGDAMKDCMALVREIESEDPIRRRTALAALDQYHEKAIPALLKGVETGGPDTRLFCIGMLSGMKAKEGQDPILKALRADSSARVRTAAAEATVVYDTPLVRRALLETVWADRDEEVKRVATSALHRVGTVEEVSALLDLLSILPEDSSARPLVFQALRRITRESWANEPSLWTDWWGKIGREVTLKKVEEIVRRRMEAEFAGPAPAPPVPAPGEEEAR